MGGRPVASPVRLAAVAALADWAFAAPAGEVWARQAAQGCGVFRLAGAAGAGLTGWYPGAGRTAHLRAAPLEARSGREPEPAVGERTERADAERHGREPVELGRQDVVVASPA